MPKRNWKNKVGGFSFGELLIVLVIVSILATIGPAIFKRYMLRARDAGRVSQIAYLRTGIQAYYAEYGRYPANPTPGVACQVGSGACLAELTQYIDIPQPVYFVVWAMYYPFYYYDYGPNSTEGTVQLGAVLQTELEGLSPTRCSFLGGSWCAPSTTPLINNPYCLCMPHS